MAGSKLDVTSDAFDPDVALAAPRLQDVALPQPDVADLDNIKLCIPFVPQAARDEMEAEVGGIVVKHKAKTEEQKETDAAKRAFLCQRAAEHMRSVEEALAANPITTIIQRVRKGPLMLLRRAYEAGHPVDVVTRHARGVKGVLRGRVCGFDKYMNLLMADAEEWLAHRARTVRVRPKSPPPAGDVVAAARGDSFDGDIGAAESDGEGAESRLLQAIASSGAGSGSGSADAAAGGEAHRRAHATGEGAECMGAAAESPELTQTRHGWQQVLRKRQLARLLLRGDQIVLVALAQGPMRLPARLAHLAPKT